MRIARCVVILVFTMDFDFKYLRACRYHRAVHHFACIVDYIPVRCENTVETIRNQCVVLDNSRMARLMQKQRCLRHGLRRFCSVYYATHYYTFCHHLLLHNGRFLHVDR